MRVGRFVLIAVSVCGFNVGSAHADGQCDFIKFSRNKIYDAVGHRRARLSAEQRRQLAAMAREERAIGCR